MKKNCASKKNEGSITFSILLYFQFATVSDIFYTICYYHLQLFENIGNMYSSPCLICYIFNLSMSHSFLSFIMTVIFLLYIFSHFLNVALFNLLIFLSLYKNQIRLNKCESILLIFPEFIQMSVSKNFAQKF